MSSIREGSGRIAYVDGLRALAVLLVVMHHVVRHAPGVAQHVAFLSLQHAALDGAHGVDLFFVLSGFCLSYPVLERLRATGSAVFDLPRYIAKRAVRIVPPYYAALAIFTIAATGAGARVDAADVVKQLLFSDWHTTFVNGSFWTLCVELRWYFIFPLALALWVRAPRAFLAAAASTSVLYAFTRVHVLDVGTLLPFLLGIVAADLEIRAVRAPAAVWIAAPFVLLAAVVLETVAVMPSPAGTETALFYVQTNPGWQIAMFLFVFAAGSLPWLRGLLAFRPLVAVGTASYSIYLVHEPIVDALQRLPLGNGFERGLVAFTTAVCAGFAFWAVAERAWTRGALKARAIRAVEPYVARAFGALEIPPLLHLREPGTWTPLTLSTPERERVPAE